MTEQICETCKFHIPIVKDDFCCDNEESDGYGLETSYDDCCEEWEGRYEE